MRTDPSKTAAHRLARALGAILGSYLLVPCAVWAQGQEDLADALVALIQPQPRTFQDGTVETLSASVSDCVMSLRSDSVKDQQVYAATTNIPLANLYVENFDMLQKGTFSWLKLVQYEDAEFVTEIVITSPDVKTRQYYKDVCGETTCQKQTTDWVAMLRFDGPQHQTRQEAALLVVEQLVDTCRKDT